MSDSNAQHGVRSAGVGFTNLTGTGNTFTGSSVDAYIPLLPILFIPPPRKTAVDEYFPLKFCMA